MPEYKNGALIGGGGAFSSLVITEDGSNVVATDGSGGATAFFLSLDGTSDMSVQFDGTSGTMSIPVAGLTPATEATWWFEFTPTAATSAYFAEQHNGSLENFALYYYGGGGKRIVISLATTDHTTSIYSDLSTPLNVGTKYQVAVTIGSGVVSLYLDGVLQGTNANVGSVAYGAATHYYLAAYQGYTAFGTVKFSNMAIFNGPLSVSDLLELAATPPTMTPLTTGTVATSWWQFNTGSGLAVVDTVNARNGTLSATGTSWVGAPEPFTMANPTGLTAGQEYRFTVTSGGDRPATYGSMWESPGGASLEITQTGAKDDLLTATLSSDGTKLFATIDKDFS